VSCSRSPEITFRSSPGLRQFFVDFEWRDEMGKNSDKIPKDYIKYYQKLLKKLKKAMLDYYDLDSEMQFLAENGDSSSKKYKKLERKIKKDSIKLGILLRKNQMLPTPLIYKSSKFGTFAVNWNEGVKRYIAYPWIILED
jgi:hypothetical protein